MQDEGRLRQIKFEVDENSKTLDRIIDSIVSKYNQQLDEEITQVHQQLNSVETLTDSEVEKMVMRIPVFMYHAASGLETLGVESDMAKAVKLDVYNQRYMEAEGTIKDKQAAADSLTINEAMMEIAFTRAYRKLKTKIEMAEHVFSGAKKVLSKRMQDIEMQKNDRFN